MTPAEIERMARAAGVNTEPDIMAVMTRFAAQIAAETEAATRRACAQVAAAYGPSRPVLARNPSQLVRGRWEGEQAASAGIAAAILDGGKP